MTRVLYVTLKEHTVILGGKEIINKIKTNFPKRPILQLERKVSRKTTTILAEGKYLFEETAKRIRHLVSSS